MKKTAAVIYYSLLGLFVLLPLHALIINQLGLTPGLEDIISSWKEAVLALITGLALVVVLARRDLRRQLLGSKLIWLVLAFGGLNLAYVLIFDNTGKAEVIGLRTNLIFLITFLTALVAGHSQRLKRLSATLLPVIIYMAAAVSAFGIFQALAPSWLAQYIHNNDFTPSQPFLFVQEGGLLRINSSLWGPSQLGSYLVLPICLALWQRLRSGGWPWTLALAVMAVSLYATHSRGAWIGVGLGVALILAWQFKQHLTKHFVLAIAALSLVLLIGLGIFALKVESPLSRLIFHSSAELAFKASSNTDRFKAVSRSLESFKEQPLGSGPGTAGPASTYNYESQYSESFYVQLMVEIGALGLLLFLAINLGLGWRLWQVRVAKPLALPLLAALVGLIIMNSFHHTWADAATAIIWWGSAGLVIGSKS